MCVVGSGGANDLRWWWRWVVVFGAVIGGGTSAGSRYLCG